MLTAHQTIKNAWSKFTDYPRLKQVLLFNFVAFLPVLFVSVAMPLDNAAAPIITLLASIPSWIVAILTVMSVVHYSCNGWLFNSFQDFLRPPSSIWRYFWKSVVVFFVILLPVAIAAAGMYAVTQSNISFIIGGVVLFLVALYLILKYMVKLVVVQPYFIMNDEAPLKASLAFSDGYYWYLSKVLGWMFFYGLLIIIVMAIGMFILGIASYMLGTWGEAIMTCFTVLIQILITTLSGFIYAETYKQIAENKA